MKKFLYAQLALLLILIAITANKGFTLLNGIAMTFLAVSIIANVFEIRRDSNE